MTKVAVTNRFLTMLPEVMAELKELYPDVKVNTEIPKMNEDQLIEFLQGIDVVLAGLDPYTDKVLSKLPDLKVIACCSAGVDHIDPLLMQKYQVRMGWVPGVNKHSVSELALSHDQPLAPGKPPKRRHAQRRMAAARVWPAASWPDGRHPWLRPYRPGIGQTFTTF